MITPKDVLTIEETCEILKISKKTLYQLIKSKKLPAVKVGRGWRILRPAIEEYLSSGGIGENHGKNGNPNL